MSPLVGKAPELALLVLLALLAGCGSPTRRELEQIGDRSDPRSLALVPGYNDYVQRAVLADGTEAGVISFRDGSSSRYWFRSHHLTDDMGGTLFRLSDGTELFMSGWFCCEVQLPEQQLSSLDALREFICENDGISP